MRLDHLLSKEKCKKLRNSEGQRFSSSQKYCSVLRMQGSIWGCSSAGRAPALQAGGQEFDPPHLHLNGRIAQVVRAHA